jgi:hypothetical protein
MATQSEKRDWQFIAEQASKETNPAKLRTLVEQLCFALNDRKKNHVSEKPDSGHSTDELNAG